jgi:hypothetical protein
VPSAQSTLALAAETLTGFAAIQSEIIAVNKQAATAELSRIFFIVPP